jgi:hypothetical protein
MILIRYMIIIYIKILLFEISQLNQKWISEFGGKLDKDIIIRVNKELAEIDKELAETDKEVGKTYLVALFWDED